jgi:hypothetical protein
VELTSDMGARFARIALGHVGREFPHKLDHVMLGASDAETPRALHPVFFGSYDWHSCVHGWWLLLSVRRLFPDLPEAREIEALAAPTFTPEKLAAELAYVKRPTSRGFERPYGWGWLLALHEEAARHEDTQWGARLEPLARAFAERLRDYLKVLTYPITVGTHFNTSFALVLARSWAEGRDASLLALIDDWAMAAFAERRDYAGWEPGGDEFLSPVLTAALLMSRVMPHTRFAPWLDSLVIANGWIEREGRPVTVSDRSDGKLAHLDGLNLSRAWCLRELGPHIADPATRTLFDQRAQAHLAAALPHLESDYMGEHWLASFALLALLADPLPKAH